MSDDERRPGTTGTPTDADIDRSMIGYRGRRRVAEILVDEEIVSPADLERALGLQRDRLADVLVEIGACKPEDLDRALTMHKLGMTRAQKFRFLLRIALVAVLVLTVGVCAMVLRLESNGLLLVRLQRGDLAVAEVQTIVNDPESPYAVDALRSLATRLTDKAAPAVLTTAMHSERWYVRLYAAVLAKDSGAKSLIPELITLLVDPNRLEVPMPHEALEVLSGTKLPRDPQAWLAYARSQGLAPQHAKKDQQRH